jgi:hypothetical protein
LGTTIIGRPILIASKIVPAPAEVRGQLGRIDSDMQLPTGVGDDKAFLRLSLSLNARFHLLGKSIWVEVKGSHLHAKHAWWFDVMEIVQTRPYLKCEFGEAQVHEFLEAFRLKNCRDQLGKWSSGPCCNQALLAELGGICSRHGRFLPVVGKRRPELDPHIIRG